MIHEVMTSAPLLSSEWEVALTSLPVSLDLDQTAIKCGALKRRREISSGKDLLRLAFAYGPCGMSLRSTAAWACMSGLGKLSDVAVLNRLKRATQWLEYIAAELLADTSHADFPSGYRLRLIDGTTVSAPGSKGTDFKIHASYNPATARFAHLEISDGRGAECLTRNPVNPGEIHIADRGYAFAKGLHPIISNGGDFIVRAGWRKFRLFHPDGSRLDLFSVLSETTKATPIDRQVIIQGRSKAYDVPARLIAIRKPPAAIEQEKKRLRRISSKKGSKLTQKSLIAAEYMLLVTSLPKEDFDTASVADLYRLRWQIELAFKRLKSILHIDRLPAKDPALAKSWLLAHLILALLIERKSEDLLADAPEEESEQGRNPSTWRVYKLLRQSLISAIQGVWDLSSITFHGYTFWRTIWESPRRRKRQQIPRLPCLS
ncbi:Transposase DDE domain protein [Pseudovibrio sp. Ad37]|nr:Transposase DDE domain protein [Pseudovibrio sp. Ad37]